MLRQTLQQSGQILRSTGKALDAVGATLEGKLSYTEHLNPSTRVVAHAGKSASIDASAFVALNASVIGDVEIGAGSSVWYSATLRGDVNRIKVGMNTNIQDQVVVHAAKFRNDFPTVIGNNVTVCPNAVLHACTVEDGCIIGTGAQVLDGSKVSKNSMVAAGSIVTEGKTIPEGQLWSGVPARHVRDLTSQEIDFISKCSADYVELAHEHALESAKSFEELEADEERRREIELFGKEIKPVEDDDKDEDGLFFKY